MIYAAAVPALRKKERGDQNRMRLNLPQKMVQILSEFHPLLEG
jgi:hypothetical protein